jgi:diaminopimelate epimerase
MTLKFSKYEGTGNDFIIIDDRKLQFPVSEKLISKLCDRHFGIGADGLLLVQHSEGYDFGMNYFNSDGSAATFCGNGGRCITAFAHQMGICGNICRFMAADGIHHAQITENSGPTMIVELGMQDAVLYSTESNLYYLNTGTYHVVKFVENPDNIDVVETGREIRFDSRFGPHGTNVNFAKMLKKQLYVRTYEKGVENETLSCGTGVTASAIAASLKYGGTSFYVNTAGGRLYVSFERADNTFKKVKLTGPAKLVFEGAIEIQ